MVCVATGAQHCFVRMVVLECSLGYERIVPPTWTHYQRFTEQRAGAVRSNKPVGRFRKSLSTGRPRSRRVALPRNELSRLRPIHSAKRPTRQERRYRPGPDRRSRAFSCARNPGSASTLLECSAIPHAPCPRPLIEEPPAASPNRTPVPRLLAPSIHTPKNSQALDGRGDQAAPQDVSPLVPSGPDAHDGSPTDPGPSPSPMVVGSRRPTALPRVRGPPRLLSPPSVPPDRLDPLGVKRHAALLLGGHD
jgi:hypothetical protein